MVRQKQKNDEEGESGRAGGGSRKRSGTDRHLPHVGIPKVTLSIIAATNANGRYANAGMQALAIIKTPIDDRMADILEVAPFVMFKLVRAKAAVQGNPPARPVSAWVHERLLESA